MTRLPARLLAAILTKLAASWPSVGLSPRQRSPSDDGEYVRLRFTLEDMATALRESERAYRRAQDAIAAQDEAGFGLSDHDLVTGTTTWSPHTWRLYGRSPQPVGPTNALWLSWLHPLDRDQVAAADAAALHNPERKRDAAFRVIWPDGTVRRLSRKGSVLRDPDGRPVRVVDLSIDATRADAIEAAAHSQAASPQRRSTEPQAAAASVPAGIAHALRMQALGQLASGIAHDFSNVLQAISGAMALIERRVPTGAGVERLTAIAGEAIERGISITRRLLAFSRGGDPLVALIDAGEILQGLHEILRHTLGAPIAIETRFGSDPCPVRTDRHQLETVLINLAINARDAMPNGGRLILSADLETGPSGAWVRIRVTDTGTGMAPEILARAKEAFFTTKRPGSGTGLGLPMAQAFADQGGGILEIDSRPGEGTTVSLRLPPAQEAVAPITLPQRPPLPPTVRASSARILLVDDEHMIREVLTLCLEDAGYRVTAAADGTEASSLLAQGPGFAALVTDLSMPGLDGIAVIRAAHQRFPSMPAVLLTGVAADDVALMLLPSISGPVCLLRKPVHDGELLDCLDAMLTSHRHDAPRQVAPAT